MAIKGTNAINQNIQSTYHIEQEIERNEEVERKNKKMITNYNLQSNYIFNPFNLNNDIYWNPFVSGDGYNTSDLNPFNLPEESEIKEENKNPGNFVTSDLEIKRKKSIHYDLNNKNDGIEKIKKEFILSNFDGKILNEMTLIYNIEDDDKIKIF